MVPLRVRVETLDGGGGDSYAFHRSPIRVGRGALNDLRIDHPHVSTFHGLIQFDEEGVRFVDLGSTNGSFLDGKRLERNAPATLGPGSNLTVGGLRLVLSRGAAVPPRPRLPSSRLPQGPGAKGYGARTPPEHSPGAHRLL